MTLARPAPRAENGSARNSGRRSALGGPVGRTGSFPSSEGGSAVDHRPGVRCIPKCAIAPTPQRLLKSDQSGGRQAAPSWNEARAGMGGVGFDAAQVFVAAVLGNPTAQHRRWEFGNPLRETFEMTVRSGRDQSPVDCVLHGEVLWAERAESFRTLRRHAIVQDFRDECVLLFVAEQSGRTGRSISS